MRLKSICFPFLCFCLFISACIDIPAKGTPQEVVFFDMKNYFKEEVKSLAAVKKIKKRVAINGVEEELIQDSINFEEEFSVFKDSDINRVAWFDKYQVDSIKSSTGKLETVTYTALDEGLKTQSIVLAYKNAVVHQIKIKNSRSSLVSDAAQELEYKSGVGYSIKSNQDIPFSDERILSIEVEFIR